MNRKGFTLVEVIAMMTVLGILMLIAVPNISGILKSNRESIQVEDINKMIETTKRKIKNNEVAYPPKDDAKNYCSILLLKAINDNDSFSTGVNGGEYMEEASYIVIKRVDSADGTYTYEYYVKLIEKKGDKYFSMGPVDFKTFSDNPKKYSAIMIDAANAKNLEGTSSEILAEVNKSYKQINGPIKKADGSEKDFCSNIYSFLK